jgi:hypothetical protein
MRLEKTYPVQPKSDRVARLTASCLRSLVWRRYSREISPDQALNLGRIYDLRSAMETIKLKLELHRPIPDESARFGLAVTEAVLTPPEDPAKNLNRIIQVRRESANTRTAGDQGELHRETLIRSLQILRRDWELWVREYSHFIEQLGLLHRVAIRELNSLSLNPEIANRAYEELQGILLRALEQASEL